MQKLSIALEVDGHRADLIMMKAEKAMATFEGRSYVTIEDVEAVAENGISSPFKIVTV